MADKTIVDTVLKEYQDLVNIVYGDALTTRWVRVRGLLDPDMRHELCRYYESLDYCHTNLQPVRMAVSLARTKNGPQEETIQRSLVIWLTSEEPDPLKHPRPMLQFGKPHYPALLQQAGYPRDTSYDLAPFFIANHICRAYADSTLPGIHDIHPNH